VAKHPSGEKTSESEIVMRLRPIINDSYQETSIAARQCAKIIPVSLLADIVAESGIQANTPLATMVEYQLICKRHFVSK
jgi:hypothetical protein